MARPTFEIFKQKALTNSQTKAEYERLKPEYELKKQLITIRKEMGITQEQLAELLHTTKSAISRLESFGYGSSPRFETLTSYANALSYTVSVELLPSGLATQAR